MPRLLAAFVLPLLACATLRAGQPAPAAAPAPLRVVLVGDSTVSNYAANRPIRGWGQYIGEHFKPGAVVIINLAKPGRSTKTFIEEGRWKKALEAKPDYVLIQFGHNDSHAKGRPESTDAATDYRAYLRRYVDDTRAAGAVPILVTPMVRRTFDASGHLDDTLLPYADAMKAVAAEQHVALVDLNASSKALVEQLGPGHAQSLADRPNDPTHFNEKGARAMADLVARGLRNADPRLAEKIVE